MNLPHSQMLDLKCQLSLPIAKSSLETPLAPVVHSVPLSVLINARARANQG